MRKIPGSSEHSVFAYQSHADRITPFYIYNGLVRDQKVRAIGCVALGINQGIGAVSGNGLDFEDLLKGIGNGDVLPGKVGTADDGSAVFGDLAAHRDSSTHNLALVGKPYDPDAAFDDIHAEFLDLVDLGVGGNALEVHGLGKDIAKSDSGVSASDFHAQNILCVGHEGKACRTAPVCAFHLACFGDKALGNQFVNNLACGYFVEVQHSCNFCF